MKDKTERGVLLYTKREDHGSSISVKPIFRDTSKESNENLSPF